MKKDGTPDLRCFSKKVREIIKNGEIEDRKKDAQTATEILSKSTITESDLDRVSKLLKGSFLGKRFQSKKMVSPVKTEIEKTLDEFFS